MSPAGTPPRGGFVGWVFQDWTVNAGYRDSQLVLASYRLAQWAMARWGLLGRQWCAVYRLATSLLVGVEFPAEALIGPRLRLFHPHGVVINPGVVLGADCVLRQNVTIGNAVRRDGSQRGIARAGDFVEFGAGCVVVGDLLIGDHARIGALALVTRDVPAWGVVRPDDAPLVRVEQSSPVPEASPPGRHEPS